MIIQVKENKGDDEGDKNIPKKGKALVRSKIEQFFKNNIRNLMVV